MLLPDGSRLAPVDAMVEIWTGAPPANRCPRIHSLEADRSVRLTPGQSFTANVNATDPEHEPLTFRWVLRADSGTIGSGGDFQQDESVFDDAVAASGSAATVTMPQGAGGYRLFVYVFDGNGGAAVANLPLLVSAPGVSS
jgi:hypothetical protein